MGLELLSLVNARMALLKEAEVLRYERDNLKNSALGLETHVKSAQTAQTTSEVGSFEMPCSCFEVILMPFCNLRNLVSSSYL